MLIIIHKCHLNPWDNALICFFSYKKKKKAKPQKTQNNKTWLRSEIIKLSSSCTFLFVFYLLLK